MRAWLLLHCLVLGYQTCLLSICHTPKHYQLFQQILFQYFRSKWLSNKWTRGTYSHVSVNSDTSTSHYTDLARPIYIDGVPRILLAGEATHSHFYSTTHGAFESGQKQSTFLYNYINNKCNPQYYKFVKG